MARGDLFLTAVDLLSGGHCVEILGERGSGRSYLLRRVSAHFETLGWNTIEILGVASAKEVSFAALDLAGVHLDVADRMPPFANAHRSLSGLVRPGKTLFVIDDVEWIDKGSRSVIDAVSAKLGTPLIFTRSKREAMSDVAGPVESASGAFSLELEAMSYVEMEAALAVVLGASIDTQTMSQVFAKAGGNIGLAAAIVVAAQRAGNIEVRRGVAHATGELWTSMLTPLARRMLQGVTPEEVSSLQILALLGPADLDTAVLFVKHEQILLLEELSFLATHESPRGVSVLVQHALLVDYFRHETKPAKRIQIVSHFEAVLADVKHSESQTGLSIREDSALFVRMVHEKARLNTLQAREGWLKQRSLATATGLLFALTEDSTGSDEEVKAIIAGVEGLEGTQLEHAEWEMAHAIYQGYGDKGMAAAVELLEEAARKYPEYDLRLRAQASLLRTEFEPLPEAEPFKDVALAPLDRVTRLMVVMARSFWLMGRGCARDADVLLRTYVSESSIDSRLVGLVIYAKLALNQNALASQIIDSRFADATTTLDSRGIRSFGFMRGVEELMTRRTGNADQILEAVSALGMPTGVAPSAYVGLATLTACSAVRKGQSSAVRQNLADMDLAGYNDGIMPGMQRALIYAQIEVTAGNLAAASAICRENGDRLWARGARFAAVYAYLDAMQLSPDAEAWQDISMKVQEVDSPAVERLVGFVDPLVHGDTEAVLTFVQSAAAAGEEDEATQFAQIALTALDAMRGGRGKLDAALESLKEIAASGGLQELVSSVQLSARERQVAELISSGLSNPRIAEVLVLSIRTVESHVNRLMKKLGASSREDIRAYFRTAIE